MKAEGAIPGKTDEPGDGTVRRIRRPSSFRAPRNSPVVRASVQFNRQRELIPFYLAHRRSDRGIAARGLSPSTGNGPGSRFGGVSISAAAGNAFRFASIGRERKVPRVDKILITTDSAATPRADIDAPESPRSGGGGGPTNSAPVLAPIGNQSVAEGGTLNLTITASDPDSGDTLTMTMSPEPAFGVFTDNGDGTASWIVTPGPGDAGSTSITVTATDNGSPVLNDAETFTLTVSQPGGGTVFQQNGSGLLVMEAENFETLGGTAADPWTTESDGGASNGLTLRASTTGPRTQDQATAPWAEYLANFVQSGTHHIWARVMFSSSSMDSFYVSIDGAPWTIKSTPTYGQWIWVEVGSGHNVSPTGQHSIRIHRRERGVYVDKIVLTTDGSFVPSGTGPAESPRQ